MTSGLQGKVVFVTGAGRGTGRTHCVRFAEEGSDVIALDIASAADDLEHTAAEVRSTGSRCAVRTADVRDLAAVVFLASDAARYITGTQLVIDAGLTAKSG